MKWVQNRDKHETETRITAVITTFKWNGITDVYTFLLHQNLQLIFNGLIPFGDVYVQGVVATRLLICSLLPDLKRLQQAVPGLGAHMIN